MLFFLTFLHLVLKLLHLMESLCHLTRLIEMNICHENFIFVKMSNGKGLWKTGILKKKKKKTGKKDLF